MRIKLRVNRNCLKELSAEIGGDGQHQGQKQKRKEKTRSRARLCRRRENEDESRELDGTHSWPSNFDRKDDVGCEYDERTRDDATRCREKCDRDENGRNEWWWGRRGAGNFAAGQNAALRKSDVFGVEE